METLRVRLGIPADVVRNNSCEGVLGLHLHSHSPSHIYVYIYIHLHLHLHPSPSPFTFTLHLKRGYSLYRKPQIRIQLSHATFSSFDDHLTQRTLLFFFYTTSLPYSHISYSFALHTACIATIYDNLRHYHQARYLYRRDTSPNLFTNSQSDSSSQALPKTIQLHNASCRVHSRGQAGQGHGQDI
jgi:hypothetical protein